MWDAVYNSGIPETASKSVTRALGFDFSFPFIFSLLILTLAGAILARGSDWGGPEQNLARKIVALTGPCAVAVSFENRSSLSRRDSDIIQNGLRSELARLGLRFVNPDQSAAAVTITLSENPQSYVWVAEIRQSAGDSSVVIVSAPRPESSLAARDSVPMSLRKIPLWTQADPILDVAVLEEGQTPEHIAVLDPERVSLYRLQGGKWQQEQALAIGHARPWPRDLRGRLIPTRDRLLDVYLPGVMCTTRAASPLALNCRESDDPWPLGGGTPSGQTLSVFPSAGLGNGASTVVAQLRGFFAPTRNFFTGAITPAIGKFTAVPKFYSAAVLPREKYMLWLFAATDSELHLVDGMSEQAVKPGWGSDVTSVKTACGAGWQVLATSAGDQPQDFVRAYELPDRDAIAVSPAVEVTGPITALWTEARGDTAVAVDRNSETGNYEAFRLAMVCNQ